MRTKWAVIAMVCTLLTGLLLAGGVAYVKIRVVDATQNETQTRQEQFCQLFVSIRRDRVQRLENTLDYLITTAGQEPTAINQYIKQVSLPQTIQEVKREGEQLPRDCFPKRKGDKK